MPLKPAILVLASSIIGCSDEKNSGPTHVTCDELDSRDVINRIDGLVSDNPEVLDLDGHCLEATNNVKSGDAWFARFEPKTGIEETANYHIDLYLLPMNSDTRLEGFKPSAPSASQCVGVLENQFCGHIDQNEADPTEDNVDFRIVSGYIDITVGPDSPPTRPIEGDFEWSLATISYNERDGEWETNGTSVILGGTLQLSITD